MRLYTLPLSLVALYATGQTVSAASGPINHAHLVSRANGNTNMPEFIDVAQLIAPATVAAAMAIAPAPDKPRPTARIEDVGAATIAAANQPHPKPVANAQIVNNPHAERQAPPSPAQHDQNQKQQQNKEANDVDQHDQPRPASGVRRTRTVVSNRVKTATVFDDVETSSAANNIKKGAAKQLQSSTSERQPGMLNRFGDDESDGGYSLKNSALTSLWRAGALALMSVGYFSL